MNTLLSSSERNVSKRARARARSRNRRIYFEALEQKILLNGSVFTWNDPAGNHDFNGAGNWKINGVVVDTVPGKDDTAEFDAAAPNVTLSATLTVAKFVVTAGTVSLNLDGKDLTVTGDTRVASEAANAVADLEVNNTGGGRAQFKTGIVVLGDSAGAQGTFEPSGRVAVSVANQIIFGLNGQGAVAISAGAVLRSHGDQAQTETVQGGIANKPSSVDISGAGSLWQAPNIVIGDSLVANRYAKVTVSDHGTIEAGTISVVANAGGAGTLSVTAAGQVRLGGDLTVGNKGTDGTAVHPSVTVDGSGSQISGANVFVDYGGTLNVTNQATLSGVGELSLGQDKDRTAEVTSNASCNISGGSWAIFSEWVRADRGATLTATGESSYLETSDVAVGTVGTGTLNILDSAFLLDYGSLTLGATLFNTGGSGVATLDGAVAAENLYVGFQSVLNINAPAVVTIDNKAVVGYSAQAGGGFGNRATANVSGTWYVGITGDGEGLLVGDSSRGDLILGAGGVIQTSRGSVGAAASSGFATIRGTWTLTDDKIPLTIGNGQNRALVNILGDGTVDARGGVLKKAVGDAGGDSVFKAQVFRTGGLGADITPGDLLTRGESGEIEADPPGTDPFGTLTIDGNLDATLGMTLDSVLGATSDSNNRLHVTGTAAISGDLDLFLGAGVSSTSYAPDDSFTVLTADGGLYGQFSNLPAGYYDYSTWYNRGLPQLNSSALEWHLDYTSTSVILTVVAGGGDPISPPTFHAAGNVTITRSGDFITIQDYSQQISYDATRAGLLTIDTGTDNDTITLDQTNGAIGFHNPGDNIPPITITGTGYDTLIVSGGSLRGYSDVYSTLDKLSIQATNGAYLDLIGDQRLNWLDLETVSGTTYLTVEPVLDAPGENNNPGTAFGLYGVTSLTIGGNLVVHTMNDIDPTTYQAGNNWVIVSTADLSGQFANLPEGIYTGNPYLPELAAGLSWAVHYDDTAGEVTLWVVPHPYVVSIARAGSDETTNATTVNYTVTFSEPVTSVDAMDFALLSDGVDNATIGTPTSTDGGTTWTVPVVTGSGAGTLELDLVDNDSITNQSYGVTLGSDYTDDGSFTGQAYTLVDTLYWYDTTNYWASGNWNSAPAGDGASLPWTDRTQFAVFPDLLGGTVTVSSTINLAGLDIEGPGYSFTGSGTLNLTGAATLTINADTSIASTLTGSAGLTKQGSATLTLSGTNSYTGTTTINDGTLTLGRNNALGSTSNGLTVGDFGTLDLNGYNLTIGALTGNGIITNNRTYSNLIVASGSFDGLISDGTGTIYLQVGSGVLTLSGANTYTQGTIVSGTLLVTNTTGSATGSGDIELDTATLGGSGIISGTVYCAGPVAQTIAPSATLSSDSATTLTLGGLQTGAQTTLAFNLVSPINDGTSSNDVIVIGTGGLNLTHRPHLAITGHGYGVESLGYYKAIQYSGTITGLATNAPPLIPPTVVNEIAYVPYTTRDSGFIDIHRGFEGDANDDGTVNIVDMGIVSSHYNATGATWSIGDFNGDTHVDIVDWGTVTTQYNQTLNESGMQMMTTMGPATTPTLSDEEFAQIVLFVRSLYDILTTDQIAQAESSLDALATFTTGGHDLYDMNALQGAAPSQTLLLGLSLNDELMTV